jgi:hypothetical protein
MFGMSVACSHGFFPDVIGKKLLHTVQHGAGEDFRSGVLSFDAGHIPASFFRREMVHAESVARC